MEFVMGLVTGYLLTWPAIVVLCLFAIFMEHTNSTGWAVFFGLASLVVSYFVFNIPLQTLLIGIGGYLALGTIWSFWRYKRFVTKGAQEALNNNSSIANREAALQKLKASNHIGRITSWFVIWPISVIENLTGDIINLIHTAITEWFHEVYEKIFNSSTGNAYAVIAEQKEAEKARQKADAEAKKKREEESKAILDGLKDGSLNVDKDGVVR